MPRRGRRATAKPRPKRWDASVAAPSVRRCAVTRAVLPKQKMVRFVVGPGRVLVADLAGRLPGRGIWLSAERDVLETARARGVLARAVSRAAGGPVAIPSDLRARLEAGLAERLAALLRAARRAGQAVWETEKVRAWLARGDAGLLLQAEDGGDAEPLRTLGESSGSAPAVNPPLRVGLSAAALGRVSGAGRVVHVALRPGRLADAVRTDAARLAGFDCGRGIDETVGRG